MFANNSAAPVAGTLLLRRMTSLGGLASNFVMAMGGTAGVTLTGVFGCLVTAAGVILAQTADRSADAVLGITLTLWTSPFIAPVQLPAGDLYGGLLVATAVTMPSFCAFRTAVAPAINLGKSAAAGNLEAASGPAGLAVLPASPINMAALLNTAATAWMAVT